MLGPVRPLFQTLCRVAGDLGALISSAMGHVAQLAAEKLPLRKQLALYRERQVKPRRADDATRITLVALSLFVDWRHLLTVVKPETLIGWHRKGFRLWWRWKSGAAGHRFPWTCSSLITTMAAANRTWGEERIAYELLVKLGIRVSPRTVRRRYMPSRPPRARPGTQAWSTFVRNHARTVFASDFFVVVTATFRIIYVFVVLEVRTRRIRHCNVTHHPTADWTSQQFRMIVPGDQGHQFVTHDRDSIYSEGVDRPLASMGLAVLKTPACVPQANTFRERLIGTIRRECVDLVIPVTERHLRAILREWISHYNRGRTHSSLGPGLPDPPLDQLLASNGHQLPDGHRVAAMPIWAGCTTSTDSRPLERAAFTIFARTAVIVQMRSINDKLQVRSRSDARTS